MIEYTCVFIYANFDHYSLPQVVQNESYHQLRQTSKEAKEGLSSSYSEHTTIAASQTEEMEHKSRKRSASMGENYPSFFLSAHSRSQSPEGMAKTRRSLSSDIDDHVFVEEPANTSLQLNSSSSCTSHISVTTPKATPTPDGTRPTIEICDTDGCYREEVDGDFENMVRAHGDELVKGAGTDQEGEELNLEDISFGFKRRSLSFESLLESYKDDEGLHRILHSSLAYVAEMGPRLSSSFQSLGDVSSDEESYQEEQEPDEISSVLDNISDMDSSTCWQQSPPVAEEREDICRLPLPGSRQMNYSLDNDDEEITEDMLRGSRSMTFDVSLKYSHEKCVLESSRSLEECPISLEESGQQEVKHNSNRSESTNRKHSNNKPQGSKFNTLRKISKGRVNVRKRTKLSPPTLSNEKRATPTVEATPTDMLIKFQIASMGCVLGVESREEVRAVMRESQTNTEKDNYDISKARESD